MKYPQRIKELREKNKKNQIDIAKVLNTTQQYYGKYELGKRPMPIEHLTTLCEYYNVSPEYILGYIDEPKPLR